MYKIEKRFTLPIGHRLSKHAGRCSSIHGHNLTVLIGVKSKNLNDNDMVIDFTNLKEITTSILDKWDHTLLLNGTADEDILSMCVSKEMRFKMFPFDPTAEKLSEILFNEIGDKLPNYILMDYVTIFENENSKATYTDME
jgi:6-pyruvoyltetrahydropterin/6-carboxytetrahydropterin synthase